jgi:hypothetical protein
MTELFEWKSRSQEPDASSGAGYHAHFGSFLGLSAQEAIEQAIDELRSIVAEEIVVVVSFRGGEWTGSMCVNPSEPVAPRPGLTRHVYSWRGTYDRVIEDAISPPG